MKQILFDNIVGVFTNGDPDNISTGHVKTLKNFRPVNGKLVKTHGSGETDKFPNLKESLTDYTITNLYTFNSSDLSGNPYRTLVVKVDNKTQGLVFEINNGF